MSIANNEPESTMLKKILLAIAGAAAAASFSSAALADHKYKHWDRDHGWRGQSGYHGHYYAPRPVVVVPAPRVVYAAPPPPVVYYPAPAPVYHAPAYPVPGVSIRLHLPL